MQTGKGRIKQHARLRVRGRQTSMEGADEGEHEVAEWVFSVRVGLGFQLQHCQHFPFFAWLCSPPYIGQDGVRPQNRSWRLPPCQNHSDFTTHETWKHDTGAQWKTACSILSRPGPSEMNVLAPHRLILLIHTLTPARFGFPFSKTRFITHEPSGSKPNKFTILHFWLYLTYVGLLTMCAFDIGDIQWRYSTRSKGVRRSKMSGVDSTRDIVGIYEKIFLRVTTKRREHVCLYNVGVGSQ